MNKVPPFDLTIEEINQATTDCYGLDYLPYAVKNTPIVWERLAKVNSVNWENSIEKAIFFLKLNPNNINDKYY